jgi:hypothetical protein
MKPAVALSSRTVAGSSRNIAARSHNWPRAFESKTADSFIEEESELTPVYFKFLELAWIISA